MLSAKSGLLYFSYEGATYVKDADDRIKFEGYDTGAKGSIDQFSLSDASIDSSVKETPLWNLVFDPNVDVTSIRVSGFVIKVKKYFIRENDNSTVFLQGDNIFIKITITNGEIDEYENLPIRIGDRLRRNLCGAGSPSKLCKKSDYAAIAWLIKNNNYVELHQKRLQEGSLC